MPRVTASAPAPAISFALRLTAWSLGLFGLFRLPWVGAHILLPATRLQAAAGAAVIGPSTLPIEATLACSGADALALCLAAIVAYPVAWRRRAAGVALGTTAILALNTIRIGTLGRAASSPPWFHALHVYVWPAVLTIAIAALVFTWMQTADQAMVSVSAKVSAEREALHPRSTKASAEREPPSSRSAKASAERGDRVHAFPNQPGSLRFALVTVVCLVAFTLASPVYLASPRVLAVAMLVARAAAFLLRGTGMEATASAGVLATPTAAFLVTQECIASPLIPVYVAAVLVWARPWRRAALWAAAAVPLFVALGIARLLVVAVPAAIGRPQGFLIHAFSQMLVGASMVGVAAFWRHGGRAATCARAAAALVLAMAFVQLLGASYTRAILGGAIMPVADPQGALRFLPSFQFGLFLALWVAAFASSGWTRFVSGAVLLAVVQMAVFGGLHWFAAHTGIAPLVRDVRAWALVGPALVIAAVVNLAPPRR